MDTLQNYSQKLLHYLRSGWNWKKILTLCASAVAVVIGFTVILFLMVLTGVFGHIPDKSELLLVENPAASEVYSADSVLIGKYFIQERSNLTFQELPKGVIHALLATEDVRFYDHGAIDYRSMGRVFFKSFLLQSDASGGGSTLTQQLAKNLYPRRRHLIGSLVINKFREMIIASRIESAYTKDEILTLYLNTISFGDNTYGLDAAAQRFYSVKAGKLSIDQAAVLLGMLKATHYYNPRLFPEHSKNRRNVVLSQMNKYNLLPDEQLDSLRKRPIALAYNNLSHNDGLAPYFRDYIRDQLLAFCETYNAEHEKDIHLYTSGLKIYTTIDSRLQRYAEEAVTHQMNLTQKNFLSHWGKQDPWPADSKVVENAVRKSDHYKSLKEQGISNDSIDNVMNTAVPMAVLTPDGLQDVTMSPKDSVRHYLKFLNAGVLAMDPRDGAVRVWVGGINHEYFQYDHVKETTRRQVGSTFKPIVYAAALEQGAKPCDFISAEKVTYTNMEDWAPKNSEENYGLKYSMPGALAYSVNTVSVRVLEKGGMDNTIKLARKLGITSEIPKVPSMALGSADISVMEMVSAYTAFAHEGKKVSPFYLTAITNHRNEILASYKPTAPIQALSAESAELILHMLRRAVNEGTSASLRSTYGLTNDIAGKTGTTQSNTDGWFMAITPKLVIGSWVGADLPQIHFRTTSLGQGARTALPMVGEFLQKASRDNDLNGITQAKFPELSARQERKIDCASFKEDTNLLRKIFGNSKKEKKRDFGKPKKKSLMDRIFSRS